MQGCQELSQVYMNMDQLLYQVFSPASAEAKTTSCADGRVGHLTLHTSVSAFLPSQATAGYKLVLATGEGQGRAAE